MDDPAVTSKQQLQLQLKTATELLKRAVILMQASLSYFEQEGESVDIETFLADPAVKPFLP